MCLYDVLKLIGHKKKKNKARQNKMLAKKGSFWSS